MYKHFGTKIKNTKTQYFISIDVINKKHNLIIIVQDLKSLKANIVAQGSRTCKTEQIRNKWI